MRSFLAATAVSTGMLMAVAAPAFAATSTCSPMSSSASCTVSEGTIDPTGTIGIDQFNLDRQGKLPTKGTSFTDYFTFTVPSGTDIDASFTLSGTGKGQSVKPSNVMLALYMGSTVGMGTAVPNAFTKVAGTPLDASLSAGDYYLQVTGTSLGTGGGYGGTASFSSTVPLPNSVALLGMAVAGLGVAGAARRRSLRATNA